MDERISQEVARILHDKRQAMLIGSLGVSAMLTLFLWPVGPKVGLLAWMFANIVLFAVRWRIAQGYVNASVEEQNARHRHWTKWFTVGSFVNGFIWGLVPILFFTPDFRHFAVVLVLHAGYVGGAASGTSATLSRGISTYYAFSIPATLLFMLGIIINGGPEWYGFVLMVAFYTVTTSFMANTNNQSLIEQIRLRLENTDLLAEVSDQRDRAESAMMAKNRFLAAASHDLRQPVHALGLFAGTLESHLHAPEPKRILNKIKQSVTALGGLFHGLLDISKLDANVVENIPEHISLDRLLSPIQAEFEETARGKGLTLRISTNTDEVAYVDSSLLERILRNMVSNAINYTDAGTVSLDVTSADRNQLIICVADTGKGIPQAELENIFSEYHQLENPQRDRQRGLGLGLAIVRRLCALMQIPINVTSEVGVGSSFSVTIPAGQRSKLKMSPIISADEIIHNQLRVIVIDDELDIIDGMEKVLKDWGCYTISATSTKAALIALADEDTPDIIIADFRLLGDDSGLHAINQIRDEFNSDIPALLVTGDTAPEILKQASAASVQIMHKPVEPDQLKNMLHHMSNFDIAS